MDPGVFPWNQPPVVIHLRENRHIPALRDGQVGCAARSFDPVPVVLLDPLRLARTAASSSVNRSARRLPDLRNRFYEESLGYAYLEDVHER